jgi:hypothetical protein
MKHLLRIATGWDITPLLLDLKRHPFLWNAHRERTVAVGTPHSQVDDIWVRYNPAGGTDQHTPHDSVWYPAYSYLPGLRPIIRGLMHAVGGERLGGVLITRIPPGGQVLPHCDNGWHAEYYDKFAVQVASHPQQAFCYADGELATAPGDVYWFNNQESHWVRNDSPVERITLIVCIRPEVPLAPAQARKE